MTNRNMTAVEYLMNHFRMLHIWHDGEPDEMLEAFEQAKKIEKEQMKESWFDSTLQFDNAASMVDKKEFEKYYNETYGKDSNESNA